jgi:hypothetical protein
MSKPTITTRQSRAYAALQSAANRFSELQPVAKMLDLVSVDASHWETFGGVASLLERNIGEAKHAVDTARAALAGLFNRPAQDEAAQGITASHREAYALLQKVAFRFEELKSLSIMLAVISENEDQQEKSDGITGVMCRNIKEVSALLDDVQDDLDSLFRNATPVQEG